MADPAPREPLRRARDVALVLPWAGLLLLTPPLVGLLVGAGGTVLGMPPILAWLFGTWLALIGGALVLARRLRDEMGPG